MAEVPPTHEIAFLGPAGTFTEGALLGQADLAGNRLTPLATIPDVLAATSGGRVDFGFVAIENSIEGSVRPTIDTLAFEAELLIQREVIMDIDLNLVGLPGAEADQLTEVVSHPVALAQCRKFIGGHLPRATEVAAHSTVHAAEQVTERNDPTVAAISPSLSAELFGLQILARHIEDHPENQTRFVLVGRDAVPPPTGHDKTSILVFQKANQPGSLLTILQEFAARGIDLSKMESRPTKRSLGDYCFWIDFEGHITSELVADAIRELKVTQHDVKFLGSYPAAGTRSHSRRRDAEAAWLEADNWMRSLKEMVPSPDEPIAT